MNNYNEIFITRCKVKWSVQKLSSHLTSSYIIFELLFRFYNVKWYFSSQTFIHIYFTYILPKKMRNSGHYRATSNSKTGISQTVLK